jgi:hypothetical protein
VTVFGRNIFLALIKTDYVDLEQVCMNHWIVDAIEINLSIRIDIVWTAIHIRRYANDIVPVIRLIPIKIQPELTIIKHLGGMYNLQKEKWRHTVAACFSEKCRTDLRSLYISPLAAYSKTRKTRVSS